MNLLFANLFRLLLLLAFFFTTIISFSCISGTVNPERINVEINKVLILGNSITQHDPSPELGWYGPWGMAASSINNDFVHILRDSINNHKLINDFRYYNFATEFEVKFWKFDTTELKKYKDFGADLIIIRLGENVNDQDVLRYGFKSYFSALIRYLKDNNSTIICCTDSFWPNNNVDSQIEKACDENDAVFVLISDLYDDKSNTARGMFANSGVSRHPSDAGMYKIANRIWTKIRIFFR